jgi:hypothetical protein
MLLWKCTPVPNTSRMATRRVAPPPTTRLLESGFSLTFLSFPGADPRQLINFGPTAVALLNCTCRVFAYFHQLSIANQDSDTLVTPRCTVF